MNWVKEICDKLGIEENEEWEGEGENVKSFCIYKLSDDGYLYYKRTDIKMEWDIDPFDIASLLTGKLKPIWKPQEGEFVYIPHISASENGRYRSFIWIGSDIDRWYLDNNLAYRTKEEATNMANEMTTLAIRWK